MKSSAPWVPAEWAKFIVLVLELVEGETLAEVLARGPMLLGQVLRMAIQVCEAIEAAHEKNIIHRDLKASVLDPNTGEARHVPTDFAGDVLYSSWTADGQILAMGVNTEGPIWRFRPQIQ